MIVLCWSVTTSKSSRLGRHSDQRVEATGSAMKPQKSEKKHYHSHTRNVIISPQNAHEKVQQHIQEFPPQHRLPEPSPIPGEVMFTWTNLTSFQKIEYCRESWVTVWMSRSKKFWIGLNLSVIMMGLRSNSSWASDKKLFMASLVCHFE